MEKRVTDCINMFNNMTNIIYIDLSNFDSSQIENLKNMFYNCISLLSINLNAIHTGITYDLWSFTSLILIHQMLKVWKEYFIVVIL